MTEISATTGAPREEHPMNVRDDTAPSLATLAADTTTDDELEQLADERLVHALLRALFGAERGRADRAIEAAMASIERSGRRPRGRHGPRERGPHRRHVSMLARVLPALAIVILAAVLARVATDAPPAVADPLERVVSTHVKAGTRAGPRRYSLLIERDTPGGLVPIRGTLDVAPGGDRRPDGSPLRGGRFLVRLHGPGREPRAMFGFDGDRFWSVADDGPVRMGRSKSVIEEANQLRGIVGWLVVERALQQLSNSADDAPEPRARRPRFDVEVADAGDGRTRYLLHRQPADDAHPWAAMAPSEVVFVAGAQDRVVSELDVYWPDDESGRSRHPGRLKHLRLELLRDQAPPPEWSWFAPEGHVSPDRPVLELQEPDSDAPAERRPGPPWRRGQGGDDRPHSTRTR